MEDVRGRTILAAVDESEESMYALKWALDYLRLDSTDTLILCHSKCLPIAYDGFGAGVSPWLSLYTLDKIALEKNQEQVAQGVMQKARDICSGSPAKVEEKIVKEDAREALCDAVNTVGADFLVIGSHGYGTVKRTLLGSVSNYCAHHVKCPVLIIKKPCD